MMKSDRFKRDRWVLARHFLNRFGNHELFTQNRIFAGTFFFVMGGFVSLLILMRFIFESPGRIYWPEKVYFVTILMVITGILSVLEWDQIFFDKKDLHNLLPLPLSKKRLIGSKIAANFAYVGLMAFLFNFSSTVVYFLFLHGKVGCNPLVYFFSHFFSNMIAVWFVFFGISAIQNIFGILSRGRVYDKLSLIFQTMAITVFVSSFLWIPHVYPHLKLWLNEDNRLLHCFPPVWFASLHQYLIGVEQEQFQRFARYSILAVILTISLFFLTFLKRLFRLSSIQSYDKVEMSKISLLKNIKKRCFEFILRHSLERGIFYFFILTLKKSHTHRKKLGFYILIPIAYVISKIGYNALSGGPGEQGGLSWQMASSASLIMLFAILGIRHIVPIVIEREAGWVFDLNKPVDYSQISAGMKKAIGISIILPILLIFFLIHTWVWGFLQSFLFMTYSGAVALLVLETVFCRYRDLPFISNRSAGKGNLKRNWPFYLFGFIFYYSVVPGVGMKLIRHPVNSLVLFPSVFFVVLLVRKLDVRENEMMMLRDIEPIFNSCEFSI